jgi:hypothetical protein
MPTPRKIYKQYYRGNSCVGVNPLIIGLFGEEITIKTSAITFNGLRATDGTYSAAPAWFGQAVGYPYYDTYWVMTPPAETDTVYNFSWTIEDKGGNPTEYIVQLNMIDYCSIDLGCNPGTRSKPASMLLFLTREGGWTYFPFNGKKTFEVRIPDASTYKSSNFVLRATNREDVYDAATLTTGSLPELALDLLQSLRESIQVYEVENFATNGEQIYHPVMLNSGDFVKNRTDDRRFESSVTFIYATERVMQSQ